MRGHEAFQVCKMRGGRANMHKIQGCSPEYDGNLQKSELAERLDLTLVYFICVTVTSMLHNTLRSCHFE